MRSMITLLSLSLGTSTGCILLYSVDDEGGAGGTRGGAGSGSGAAAGSAETGGGGSSAGLERFDLGALGRSVALRDGHGVALAGATAPTALYRFDDVSAATLSTDGLVDAADNVALLDDGSSIVTRSTVPAGASPFLRCDAGGCSPWFALTSDTYAAVSVLPESFAAVRALDGVVDVFMQADGAFVESLGEQGPRGTHITSRRCADASDMIAWVTQASATATLHVFVRDSGESAFTLRAEKSFAGQMNTLDVAPDCALFGTVAAVSTTSYFELGAAATEPATVPLGAALDGRIAADLTRLFAIEQGEGSLDPKLLACPRGTFMRDDCEAAPIACSGFGGLAASADGVAVFTCDDALVAWRP
ncbi:MAG: hypothetical protein U0271_01360 [Polyangiaceae bacterium]